MKMKNLVRFVLLTTTLLVCSAPFSANQPVKDNRHAIEISIGGNGTEFDVTTYNKLRKTIGIAVANSVLDKLIIYGYGIEGGFSGCVEARPGIAPSNTFVDFVNQLNAIQPQPGTFYSVQRISHCLSLPIAAKKPATVLIAKPDNSIVCTLDSGTSLTDMQEELAAFTVYSAMKQSDGLLNATVCGIPTGQYNVYEIAKTDFDKAVALGFVAWSEIAAFPALRSVLYPTYGLLPFSSLSAEVIRIINQLGVVTYEQIGTLVFLLLPSSKGYQILVLKQDGTVSHTCDCTRSTGGNGGWQWIPSVPGKVCPSINDPKLKCPPHS